MRVVHRECDRARQWVSMDVDGELSEFESVLLDAHLAACPSCAEFRHDVSGLANALRAEPAAQLTRPIEIARVRRRHALRLAPAAAAMAAAVLGLGSLLASSQFRSGSVGSAVVHHARSFSFDPDTAYAAKRQPALTPATQRQVRNIAVLAQTWQSSPHGGPVLVDR